MTKQSQQQERRQGERRQERRRTSEVTRRESARLELIGAVRLYNLASKAGADRATLDKLSQDMDTALRRLGLLRHDPHQSLGADPEASPEAQARQDAIESLHAMEALMERMLRQPGHSEGFRAAMERTLQRAHQAAINARKELEAMTPEAENS